MASALLVLFVIFPGSFAGLVGLAYLLSPIAGPAFILAIAAVFALDLGLIAVITRRLQRLASCPACGARQMREGKFSFVAPRCGDCGQPLTVATFDRQLAAPSQHAGREPLAPELSPSGVTDDDLRAFQEGIRRARPKTLMFGSSLVAALLAAPLLMMAGAKPIIALAPLAVAMLNGMVLNHWFPLPLNCPHCGKNIASKRGYPWHAANECPTCNRSLKPRDGMQAGKQAPGVPYGGPAPKQPD